MSGDELQPFRGMAMGLHNHGADDECGDDCSFYPAPDVVEGEIVDAGSPLYRKFFPDYAAFERRGFHVGFGSLPPKPDSFASQYHLPAIGDAAILQAIDTLLAGMEWEPSAGMLATLYGRALFSRYTYRKELSQ